MIYDFHSHSTFSDGTLTPAALLRRAAAQGVGVLALTDHDTTDGLVEAADAAAPLGITLVKGVEISVTWRNQLLHIVGLGVDPQNMALQSGLGRVREIRAQRALRMAQELERNGIAGAYEGARRHCRQGILSRTHFARFLVDQGHARDIQQVFKRYLVKGRPGYVSCQWATLDEAVGWIRAAGGVAVIAHPARYKLTRAKMNELLADFVECGGEAIEVIGSGHNDDDIRLTAAFAGEYGLLASAGSDFHDPEGRRELGRIAPLPAHCTPVWEHRALS